MAVSSIHGMSRKRPVAVGDGRGVHPAVGAEAGEVLVGHHRQIGHRGHGEADEIPVDLGAVGAGVAADEIAFVVVERRSMNQPRVVLLSWVPV